MITQNVKTEVALGSMIVGLGNGDIALRPNITLDGKGVLAISNIKKNYEVGSDVKDEDIESTPVVVTFDNVDSAITLKKAIQKVINDMKDYEKAEAEKNLPRFEVSIGSIFVTSAFRSSNPDSKKIMSCYDTFSKSGVLDRNIEVTKNIVLKDGYVAYLVAAFAGLETLEVVAPDGINIKVGDEVINFTSDIVNINYGKADDAFYLIIKVGDKRYSIPAEDNVKACDYIKHINDVFKAKFVVPTCSTMNVGLVERMKSVGIDNVEFANTDSQE